MEIRKDIYAAHRELSARSVQFLEFIKDHPTAMKRSAFNSVLQHPQCLNQSIQPWPTFVGKKTKEQMKHAAVKICDLIKSIPDRIFAYDFEKIGRYYEIPAEAVELMFYGTKNENLQSLLARGDYIFSTAGLKCIEFNVVANLGGWELDLLEPLYLNTPLISQFLEEKRVRVGANHFFDILLEHVVSQALSQFSPVTGSEAEINTAIAYVEYLEKDNDPMLEYLKKQYKEVLHRLHPGLPGDFSICGLNRLNLVDQRVMLGTKRIHILMEMCYGVIPVRLMEIVKKGNLDLYNGPISQVMSNKLNLAILSENENSDLFTARERESIKRYIPWTRKLIPGETTYENIKISLADFIYSKKNHLVIKPSYGIAGNDVYLGYTVSEEKWRVLVEKALVEKNWVVQEYVESRPYLFQQGQNGCDEHHVAWGFFIFGSRWGGGTARILPGKDKSGIINVHQGAEKTIIVEVEE
jgi:hypothetical protein